MLSEKISFRTAKTIVFGLAVSFSFSTAAFANEALLQSGPMLGYSEMKEVLLWIQTKKTAKVKFEYWEKENPKIRFSTKEIVTQEKDIFTAKLIADKVNPGKKYSYELFINSVKVNRPYKMEFQTQPMWKWRTEPPEFNVAMGSCTYVNDPPYDRPGKPYGGSNEIFKSIYSKSPDIMLWLGDNVYLREADWTSKTGINNRYTHTRALPEMQPVLASSHNYAILDDHDFGPNDADRSYRNKNDTLNAFKLFWGNPTYGLSEKSGVYSKFEWGDVEFFLLDDRTFKTPNKRKTGKQELLGEEQLEWLIDSLVSSSATFKVIVIGGQVLNPVVLDFIEDYSKFPEEKEKLLNAIEREKIKGVVFVTGDRHQSELTMLKREGTYPLYDFTVSPLTAGPYDSSKENNFLRVPDTLYADHNFGFMNFSGTKNDRKLTFTLFNREGKELWKKELKASELK